MAVLLVGLSKDGRSRPHFPHGCRYKRQISDPIDILRIKTTTLGVHSPPHALQARSARMMMRANRRPTDTPDARPPPTTRRLRPARHATKGTP
jgi:hypothetical protein